jgi:sulfopyruvate decarboxylase subunit alpha
VNDRVAFGDLLRSSGFDFFTGVPDSTFKNVLRDMETRQEFGYVPAVSENVAVGLAVGAYLGGRKPAIFMQNSGLALAINALASLGVIYRISLLLVVGWRGHDGQDSPEHGLTGSATLPLLEALGVPFLVPETESLSCHVKKAAVTMETDRTPVALVCRPGVID